MNWEKIDLYVEHLFPGILLLFLSLGLFSNNALGVFDSSRMVCVLQNNILVVAVFFSASYILGVIAGLLSRMFIDWLSDYTLTPVFFKAVAKRFLRDNAPVGKEDVLKSYDESLAWATTCDNDSYRRSVRRKREKAGLIRTCFIPFVLGMAVCLRLHANLSPLISLIISLPFGLVIILPLFAYSESLIYQECLKDESCREKQSRKSF